MFSVGCLVAALWISPCTLAKTVTLGPADNHTALCLVEGDTLVLTLTSPLTPSYRWQTNLAQQSPLSPMNDSYTPPRDANSSGAQVFRFNAAAAGKATLALNFARQQPGQGPAVTQTYLVEVTIGGGEPASSTLIGDFLGTTRCADCTGIRTELKLYAKGANDFTDTIYVSTRTYLGGRNGDQSFTDRGEWALLKGDAVDPNATVYALNPEEPQQVQYMLLQPGGQGVVQLDPQMKPINVPANMNFTLKKVN